MHLLTPSIQKIFLPQKRITKNANQSNEEKIADNFHSFPKTKIMLYEEEGIDCLYRFDGLLSRRMVWRSVKVRFRVVKLLVVIN